ncbi:MAG: type II secretion system protein GspD [Pseudomonadales bacterium]|nr:type II secretion system protein GspD [Pseudomonadales bacterium]MBO6822614.1 type II secretion system protein GspD [Pseudomonadales bacterium]
MRKTKVIRNRTLVSLGLVCLVGCQTTGESVNSNNEPFYPQLRDKQSSTSYETSSVRRTSTQADGFIESGPTLKEKANFADVFSEELYEDVVGSPRKLSVNNLPVASFINQVFGEELGLSFTIEPEVQRLPDLVTLRLNEEVSPEDLFRVSQRTLAAYGVSIEQQTGLLVFSVNRNASVNDSPIVVRGKALPEVPESHRPIFMFVPLSVINHIKLSQWLKRLLKGKDIAIEGVPDANAVLLTGKPAIIEQALAMIEVFDQPNMRGKYSKVVTPNYADAVSLAKDVSTILQVEGIDATIKPPLGGVILLPLEVGNQIAVFSSDETVLDYIIEWISVLDRNQALGVDEGVFYQRLSNARAGDVVEVLNSLLNNQQDDDDETSIRFIADDNRNAVIFSGSGENWVQFLETIKKMDQPVPSVLVEVLLVEVTLNDQESTGIEFLARSGDVTYSTLGGLGLGANGLNITLDRAGETRAVLNAFYESSRANIRSRPRLMVKSGEKASIDVGNEIPVITSTSQGTDGANAPVLQNIQYRKTGVILDIQPIVHSSGYVDITLSQELSEAQQTSTSSIDSPTIFRRKLETTVTLGDGGSVLLGGLISRTATDGKSGVAGLGRIPVIGRMFRVDTEVEDRTELMMLIIPYILDSPDQAEQISDKAIELLEFDLLQ